MATADETRKSEVGSRSESGHRMERLREAIEYLLALDPNELRPEDYAEIEEAMLRVWVRAKVREDFEGYYRGLASDIHSSLKDLYRVVEDSRRHVNRTGGTEARRGAGRVARSRFGRDFCAEER